MRKLLICCLLLAMLICPVISVTQYNLTAGSKTVVVFNGTPGTVEWTCPVSTVEFLSVAGAGSGGASDGGGGGAGGVLNGTASCLPGTVYNITVGAGGARLGGAPWYGANGTNSTIANLTIKIADSRGGGGGSGAGTVSGFPGGSGGGGTTSVSGLAGTAGQGMAGGNGNAAALGGGGGGNGSVGVAASGTIGGAGGTGFWSSITGENIQYACGGGGGTSTTVVAGAAGCTGAGAGGNSSITGNALNGTANTGSGGGGGIGGGGAPSGSGASGIVVISYDSGTLVSSFTQSVNPSIVGDAVSFTDTSSGFPSTWNWTLYGVIPTNTTQNAAYTYSVVGTYNVFLNITNASGYWSNTSQTHTVTNISGFTPQDLWLAGQYLQTFQISDADTLAPITNVTLVSSSGKTYITTNGTGYLTEPYGLYTITFSSEGYSPRTISYVFDADATHAVSLTKSTTTSQSQSVWYTPWQVRIRIVDYYGKPLPGTNVTASYIATTLPSTDPSWLVGAFGVDESVAGDMINSSTAMIGSTDDNGGLSFTMFKSLQYRLAITNTTSGVSSSKTLYPSDSEYVIYVRTTGQMAYNNTFETRNGTLPWYSVNSTHLNVNMSYIDTSGCTSSLVFRVWFRYNGSEVHNTTWTVGTARVFDNHTLSKVPIGTEYLWGYNATTVC